MNKYTITIECETLEDAKIILNAVKNDRLVEGLYDDVFRPVIKYGSDKKKVEAFEIVWEKLRPYLNDE